MFLLAQNEKIDTICSTQRLDLIFTIVSRGKGETVLELLRENKILQNNYYFVIFIGKYWIYVSNVRR